MVICFDDDVKDGGNNVDYGMMMMMMMMMMTMMMMVVVVVVMVMVIVTVMMMAIYRFQGLRGLHADGGCPHPPRGGRLHAPDVAGPTEEAGETTDQGGQPGTERSPADGDDEERGRRQDKQ